MFHSNEILAWWLPGCSIDKILDTWHAKKSLMLSQGKTVKLDTPPILNKSLNLY